MLGSFWFFAKPAVYIFCFWFEMCIRDRPSSPSGSAASSSRLHARRVGVTLRHFLVLGLLAFVVTYLCVPLARRLALRLDAVDYPSARRVNKKPTPRMGGVAMAAGIAAALIVEVAGEYFFGWAGFYIHGTDRAINHAGVMCGLLTIVLSLIHI